MCASFSDLVLQSPHEAGGDALFPPLEEGNSSGLAISSFGNMPARIQATSELVSRNRAAILASGFLNQSLREY